VWRWWIIEEIRHEDILDDDRLGLTLSDGIERRGKVWRF
jgi:hypothetical protein